MIDYRIPEGVEASTLHNRFILSTPQGGRVAVDALLLSLWKYADGRPLHEILTHFRAEGTTSVTIRAGLACLTEAGLLGRDRESVARPFKQMAGPLVSVVVVAYNSRQWLDECFSSLFSQTYTPLEIIVVDNASSDGSADWVKIHYPLVKLLHLDKAQSFAGATNRGIAAAQGEYFLLLNPDVRLERDAVAQMVEVVRADPHCAAAGAKLKFLWAPAFLNGMGNRVGPSSWGEDNAWGHLDLGQFDDWKELPSACYAATLIPRAAWERVGPADEDFQMYYEDSEWSYRARLLGLKIRAAPKAVVYHAFGGRTPTGEADHLSPSKLRNVVYGRLRFAIKLIDKYLYRFLWNYLWEDWSNLTHSLIRMDWATANAYLEGWSDLFRDLPSLRSKRRSLKARRTISDETLLDLQRNIPMTLAWHGLPELNWQLIQHHYLPLIRSGRTRPMPEFERSLRPPHLLIVSHDIVDVKMAGPGMRYLEMARALSADLDVTLAIPSETSIDAQGLRLVRYREDRPGSLEVLVENSDIALVSGYLVEKFPFLESTRTRLVVDLYDPLVLENLHYCLQEPFEAREGLNEKTISVTNRLAKIGDFYICGNERQRDYWMGVLTANGRVNPRNFNHDPTFYSLIDIVGIGFPSRSPMHHPILRGIHPQIPPESRIVLWGGGIWNWLDPLTLIKAWPQVISKNPEARLLFLGTRHPNPLVPPHEMAERAQSLAGEIGEKNRSILFFEWLSYEDREALLCESDIGVSLHPIHIETRYSARTRVLDYFWARLPVLVTEGDVTSEWVRQFGLGKVVQPFDVDGVAQSLNTLLNQHKSAWAASFEPLQETLCWSQVVKPLLRFCLEGGYASDRHRRDTRVVASAVVPAPSLLTLAWRVWRSEGTKALSQRTWQYIRWRMRAL
jgi:GT2 family glycosyltransferase